MSEYHKKVKQSLEKMKTPKKSPLVRPTKYVIPSERKRDELRYQIRMKLHMNRGGIVFDDTFASNSRKKSKKMKPSWR